MATALRLEMNPANVADYYVGYTNGDIVNWGNVGANITHPYFQSTPSSASLVGFTVTDWGATRKGYVGTSMGGVYIFGGATAVSGYTTPIYGSSNAARDFVANPAGNGQGVFLKYNGEVSGVGGLSAVVSAAIYGGNDYARRIVVTSWSPTVKGFIQRANGTIDAFNGATPTLTGAHLLNPDIYRGIQVDTTTGFAYQLRGTGEVYEVASGTPPMRSSALSSSDTFVDLRIPTWSPQVIGYKLNLQGSIFEVKSTTVPTFTWTTPIALGTISDQIHPTIGGTFADAEGDGLVRTEMWVYDKETTLQPGFLVGPPNLEMYPTVWRYDSESEPTDIGPLVSLGLDGTPGDLTLPAGTYRGYARVTDSSGSSSVITGPHEFTLEYNAGAAPRLFVTPDATIGAARMSVQVPDNMLSAQQASFETNTTLGWTADANTTLAYSTTFAHRGTGSMRMTATASGNQAARTSNRFTARPGTDYGVLARVRRGATGRDFRVVLREYNTAGTVLRSTASPSVPQLDDSGADIVDDTTAPNLPIAVIQMTPTNPTSGELITFSAAASSDPQGLTLTYQWVQTAGPAMTILPDTTSVTVTATAPTVTTATDGTIALRVTNSAGRSSELAEFDFAISPVAAPTTKPIADIQVANAGATPLPGQTTDFNGTNSYDPAGRGALTYSWSITGSPTRTLTDHPIFPGVVKQTTWTTGTYPINYTVTLVVTAADGTASNPDTATIAVQNPSPTTPGTATGGVKNLKRAILFDSGTDAAERNKRFGRTPDWTMHYLTATSWTTTQNELQSVASQSTASSKRIINFGFTFPKQGGSNTLLSRTANSTEFDTQINRIGEITAGFSQATLNSLTYCIAWEHTGYWYSWGIQYGDGTNSGKATGSTLTTRTNDFKTAYRKVVNAIKNKCAAAGKTPPKIMWCCNSDPGDFHKNTLVLPSYPGDAYVDIVGFNIYDHFGWAVPSNMDDWLSWFKDFALGRIRSGGVTGNPKLLGINEMSLHMKTKQEINKTFPWGGDVIYFHQKIYDWAQGSLTAPGLHHLGHFDQANTPQWFYGAVIHFSTTGTNSTYGRAMNINDVLVANAGQYQAREASPGVRSYTGYNAIGGTKTATYQSGAARAAQYIIDRVGGPLGAGE